ncbi:hypothetical protein DFH06DRAFT_1341829 [Mycena polygramma]|nr:hypothetical protein DFH06DRAFT_1341829 [Mycena polygramma]
MSLPPLPRLRRLSKGPGCPFAGIRNVSRGALDPPTEPSNRLPPRSPPFDSFHTHRRPRRTLFPPGASRAAQQALVYYTLLFVRANAVRQVAAPLARRADTVQTGGDTAPPSRVSFPHSPARLGPIALDFVPPCASPSSRSWPNVVDRVQAADPHRVVAPPAASSPVPRLRVSALRASNCLRSRIPHPVEQRLAHLGPRLYKDHPGDVYTVFCATEVHPNAGFSQLRGHSR